MQMKGILWGLKTFNNMGLVPLFGMIKSLLKCRKCFLILLFLLELIPLKSQNIVLKDTVNSHFDSKEQAIDTLINWVFQQSPKMDFGHLPRLLFEKQWYKHDSITAIQLIDGYWLTHQFKFKKSVLKMKKELKKTKINFKQVQIMPEPLTILSVAGDGISKYEYKARVKKLQFVFSFYLWWIDGKGYWVNEIAWASPAN